jgi:hypothetical protein
MSGSFGRGAAKKPEASLGRFPTIEPPTSIRRDFSHLEPRSEVRKGLARSAVPIRKVRSHELSRFTLDARAGFLLSLVDGETTVEGLLDLSAMSVEETLTLLQALMAQGLVSIR